MNPGFGGFNYHDPSAAVIHNGKVIAAVEEDRFTRQKGASGLFPYTSVQYCLRHAGISLEDLSEIAIGYSPKRWQDRLGLEAARAASQPGFATMIDRGRKGIPSDRRSAMRAIAKMSSALAEILDRSASWESDSVAAARIWSHLGFSKVPIPIRFVEHHMAHAAAAWLPSGFSEATIVILDGVGEASCASAWLVRDNDFRTLRNVKEIFIPNSLGYLYAAVTEYLGFGAWEGEGKLMALAPYGKCDPAIDRAFSSIARLEDGQFEVSNFVLSNLGEGLSLDLSRVKASLGVVFGEPPRRPDQPIQDVHRNIAWSTQDFLERSIVAFAAKAIQHTGVRNLCVAGGVFMNCKMNMILRESPDVRAFYVQPVSRDSGVAIGASWYQHLQKDPFNRPEFRSLALGPEETDAEMAAQLHKYGVSSELCDDLPQIVAQLLAEGAVVGWFTGRAEYGPRALGQRSVLADPRNPEMREHVNRNVKSREPWRPFCPSIMAEHAASILEGFPEGHSAPFMIEAYRVKPEWRDRIPAVVHPADWTTRPQTVFRDVSPEYYRLIDCFYKLTGVPLVLNTSLNGRKEPIVNTTSEALRFFYSSGLDAMVFGKHVLRKSTRGALKSARNG
jgi:carbamoyltransferase